MSNKIIALLASIKTTEASDRAHLARLGPDLDDPYICRCEDCVDYYLRTYPEFRETEGYENWLRQRAIVDSYKCSS